MAAVRPGMQRLTSCLLSGSGTGLLAIRASPSTASLRMAIKPTRSAFLMQSRTICHKNHLDPEQQALKPPPWPYKTKRWHPTLETFLLDYFTKERFDENTVLICVEGLPCVGKTEFAKKLCEELGMEYFRDVDYEKDFLINHQGFDWRCINEILPEQLHQIGTNEWLERPDRGGVAMMQQFKNDWRHMQYIDALCHLFNTGQGVVMDKMLHCDKPWINTMAKFGHIHQETRDWFIEKCRPKYTQSKVLMRPHLVVYLDAPVEVLYERCQKKYPGNKALTLDFLAELDYQYKTYFLPEVQKHAFLLCYDWTEPADFDYVIEDVENLDFEGVDPHTETHKDWRFRFRGEYAEARGRYLNGVKTLIKDNNVRFWGVPGIDPGPHDHDHLRQVMTLWGRDAYRYRKGWNPKTNNFFSLLFKKEPFWQARYPYKGLFECAPYEWQPV